jgi:hypothetical protein
MNGRGDASSQNTGHAGVLDKGTTIHEWTPCENLKTNPKHRAMKNKHRLIVESESPPKSGGLPFLNQQKLQGL